MTDAGEGLGLDLGLDVVLVPVVLHVEVDLAALRIADQLQGHLAAVAYTTLTSVYITGYCHTDH